MSSFFLTLILFISSPVFSWKGFSSWFSRHQPTPTGNDYNYGHNVCLNNRELWDPPSTPISQKNQIGRAIYQTPIKVKEATRLIRLGKGYDLTIPLNENTPIWIPGKRFLQINSQCDTISPNNGGYCQTKINTNSIDNYGTQFDSISHVFAFENNVGVKTTNDAIFFNNIRGNEIFGTDKPFSSVNIKGLPYLGVQQLPTFFTRAFLLDIPASKGMDILPDGYTITAEDVRRGLKYGGFNEYHLSKGDVILVYTGWDRYKLDRNIYYDSDRSPVLTLESFEKIFDKKGISIVGMDIPTIERPADIPVHLYWLVCKGGFLHEGLDLSEWIKDARARKVRYVGAYVFETTPFEGAVGSGGKPMVYV